MSRTTGQWFSQALMKYYVHFQEVSERYFRHVLNSKLFSDLTFRIEEKVNQFWKEADFGYVKSVKDSLQFVCRPKKSQVLCG